MTSTEYELYTEQSLQAATRIAAKYGGASVMHNAPLIVALVAGMTAGFMAVGMRVAEAIEAHAKATREK
jgi:hypothetical protein